MATCFICANHIPTAQVVRRRVYTGASVGGFNLSSNVFVNWLLNSAIRKRPTSVRSYYAIRTVCPSCAIALDKAERRRTGLIVTGIVSAAIVLTIVLLLMPAR